VVKQPWGKDSWTARHARTDIKLLFGMLR
jgi:hypothetical protein